LPDRARVGCTSETVFHACYDTGSRALAGCEKAGDTGEARAVALSAARGKREEEGKRGDGSSLPAGRRRRLRLVVSKGDSGAWQRRRLEWLQLGPVGADRWSSVVPVVRERRQQGTVDPSQGVRLSHRPLLEEAWTGVEKLGGELQRPARAGTGGWTGSRTKRGIEDGGSAASGKEMARPGGGARGCIREWRSGAAPVQVPEKQCDGISSGRRQRDGAAGKASGEAELAREEVVSGAFRPWSPDLGINTQRATSRGAVPPCSPNGGTWA
jgi:hypothetical protein